MLRALLAADPSSVLYWAHVGSSMNPTLHPSDLLEMARSAGEALRPGDVILFVPAAEDQAVVHRILRITARGYYTRGDNNGGDDPWVVGPEDILGRVVAAWRGTRRRTIAGGRVGLVWAQAVRWRRTLDRRLSRLLHPIYRGVEALGIVRRLIPFSLRPRLVIFQTGSQCRLRLMLGRRRVIGHYDSEGRRWHIRRPFRLLVNEASLPTGP